jgi:diacylglycerol kinase (ATP)
MTSRRHLIVLNPIAGKGKAAALLPEIEALMKDRGLAYDIRVTQGVWHAAELARDAGASGYGAVIAAGGDGTVNEVVNGLMLARGRGEAIPAMGVLTVGRGNDFSYGADIPVELGACVDVIAAGRERPMDVGRVTGGDYPEGRYFANGIGVGFDTRVGLEAAKLRRVHGFAAYVIGALKTLAIFPAAPLVRLTHDGGVLEQESHQINIMNGKRLGGTFFMAPLAKNHDGLLDLCVSERLTRREMVAIMIRYTKGTQAGHPRIKTGTSSRYAIEAPNGGLVVHADGETICVDGSSLIVECLPRMISVLCDGARDSGRAARAAAAPGER